MDCAKCGHEYHDGVTCDVEIADTLSDMAGVESMWCGCDGEEEDDE